MLRRQMLAGFMVLGGLVLICCAMATEVQAVCDPSDPISPARCIPAHQSNPDEDLGEVDLGCESWFVFWCAPTQGSQCGQIEGYGHAIAGACAGVIDEQVSSCIQDSAPTLVLMQYLESTCQKIEGVCTCVYVTGSQPSGNIEVCDCSGG